MVIWVIPCDPVNDKILWAWNIYDPKKGDIKRSAIVYDNDTVALQAGTQYHTTKTKK